MNGTKQPALPERTAWDRAFGRVQWAWLPALVLFLVPVTRWWGAAVIGVLAIVNTTNRARGERLADENRAAYLTALLHDDEVLVEDATASEWRHLGTAVVDRPKFYVALTDQRILITGINWVTMRPTRTCLDRARSEVRLINARCGRFTTRFELVDRTDSFTLSFRNGSRLRGRALLAALS